MLKVVSVSQMFAYLGNADVIYNKYQGKPMFSCERAQITETNTTSAHAVIKL